MVQAGIAAQRFTAAPSFRQSCAHEPVPGGMRVGPIQPAVRADGFWRCREGVTELPRLQLVVPCYNEGDRLKPDAFLRFLETSSEFSFLFVDDGSSDRTSQMLADLAQSG